MHTRNNQESLREELNWMNSECLERSRAKRRMIEEAEEGEKRYHMEWHWMWCEGKWYSLGLPEICFWWFANPALFYLAEHFIGFHQRTNVLCEWSALQFLLYSSYCVQGHTCKDESWWTGLGEMRGSIEMAWNFESYDCHEISTFIGLFFLGLFIAFSFI